MVWLINRKQENCMCCGYKAKSINRFNKNGFGAVKRSASLAKMQHCKWTSSNEGIYSDALTTIITFSPILYYAIKTYFIIMTNLAATTYSGMSVMKSFCDYTGTNKKNNLRHYWPPLPLQCEVCLCAYIHFAPCMTSQVICSHKRVLVLTLKKCCRDKIPWGLNF